MENDSLPGPLEDGGRLAFFLSGFTCLLALVFLSREDGLIPFYGKDLPLLRFYSSTTFADFLAATPNK